MKLTPGVRTACEMFVLSVSGRKFNLDFFSQFHIITKKSLSEFRLPIPDADSIPVVATDKSGKTKAELLSKVNTRGLIINDVIHVISQYYKNLNCIFELNREKWNLKNLIIV